MIYRGARHGMDTEITAGGDPLPDATNVFQHSTQLDWGSLGSNSAQLALALLMNEVAHNSVALTYHQQFKQEVISKLPIEGWTLTSDEILDWLKDARNGRDEIA